MPEAQTGFEEPKAQVQFGIRDGEDIIFSLPAFQDDQSYKILHEGLHPLVPGDGPFHHMKVRAIVDYIHENRTRLDRAELNNVLKNSGVGFDNELNPETEVRLQSLIYGSFEDPAICALYSIAANESGAGSYNYFGNGSVYTILNTLKTWRELGRCEKDSYLKYVQKFNPAIFQFLNMRFRYGVSYSSRAKKPGLFASKWDRNFFKEECKKYGSEEFKKQIAHETEEQNQWLEILDAATSEIESISAKTELTAQSTFLKLLIRLNSMTNSDWNQKDNNYYLHSPPAIEKYRKDINDNLKRIEENRNNWEANVKVCN